jgi:hypothetical protein
MGSIGHLVMRVEGGQISSTITSALEGRRGGEVIEIVHLLVFDLVMKMGRVYIIYD